MSVQLNHTIVSCHDNQKTAEWWADLLGLEAGAQFGPFVPLVLANGVTLDFASVGPDRTEIYPIHYAFLVSEPEFDVSFGKIGELGLKYWADPRQQHEGEINHNDGGRGVYFIDPNGHYLELLTVPYGGWPER